MPTTHSVDGWSLWMFLEATAGDDAIGRAQGCTAGFNGIVRQLRIAGRLPE